MTETPERAILAALVAASDAAATGTDEALALLDEVPQTPEAFAALNMVQRTAATALLKRIEQQQDLIARAFRTALIADGAEISTLTARDVANRMEKLGALADTRNWSELVRLRNRLAHEYPVTPAEQHARVLSAVAAVPKLDRIRSDLIAFLRRQDLLP